MLVAILPEAACGEGVVGVRCRFPSLEKRLLACMQYHQTIRLLCALRIIIIITLQLVPKHENTSDSLTRHQHFVRLFGLCSSMKT